MIELCGIKPKINQSVQTKASSVAELKALNVRIYRNMIIAKNRHATIRVPTAVRREIDGVRDDQAQAQTVTLE